MQNVVLKNLQEGRSLGLGLGLAWCGLHDIVQLDLSKVECGCVQWIVLT